MPALAMLAGAALATTTALPAATAAPAARSAATTSPLADIGLLANAYGTRLAGGDIPAGSGRTAFAVMGCSAHLGASRSNHLAAIDIPSFGTISGVTTKVWSAKQGGSVHSYARSSTAEVRLVQSGLGRLSLRGVTSLAHAWYDGKRFHSQTTSSVAKLVFTPPAGDPQVLPLPAPGQPITVPGLATIRVGGSKKVVDRRHALAFAVGLRVHIIPTDSTLWVSRGAAQAVAGVLNGKFAGYSAGTEVNVAGGLLTSGRNPASYMPCQGTDGRLQGADDLDVNAGGGLHIEAVSSKQWAKRGAHASKAWEQGSVSGVNLGDGALVVSAVVGRATVTRGAKGPVTRSTAGTRIGSITANGERQDLPLDQTLEIPGLAKLQPAVVTKVAGGLKVIGLRITLLDGSGAVIDLGVAKTTIRK